MIFTRSTFTGLVALFATAVNAQYSATYLPSNAPKTTEEGQSGTNQCGTGSSQTSMCQNAYINSVDDWCIWAPPEAGAASTIGNTERIEVAWCLKDGYGTRLIPDGAITGAHFVQTSDFVQVTGVGDLTKINIPAGDAGGELDPHGADGNGNPIGGLVFSTAFGQLEQIFEWTNFVSDTEFCFRACNPGGSMAPTWCQHIYDEMGCEWNMPANYNPGVFEQCEGDSGEPMGVYGTSTFHQGDPTTPSAHPIPSSSQCTTLNTIGNNVQFTSSVSASPSTSSATLALTSASGATTTASGSSGTDATTSASSVRQTGSTSVPTSSSPTRSVASGTSATSGAGTTARSSGAPSTTGTPPATSSNSARFSRHSLFAERGLFTLALGAVLISTLSAVFTL